MSRRPAAPAAPGTGEGEITAAAADPWSGLRRLFRASMVIIPIGVLGNVLFSLLTTDRTLLASLSAFPRGYLLLAIALGLLPWATNTIRLWMWTRFVGHQLSWKGAFRITLSVDLGSAISPTAVGGGFFKWGLLVQHGVSAGAAASLTTLPTLEDAVFFAIALPAAALYTRLWELPLFRPLTTQIEGKLTSALLVALGIAFFTWLALRLVLVGHLGTRARQRGLRLFARLRRRLRSTWRDARGVFVLIAQRGKWRFMVSILLIAVQWGARYSVATALIAFLGVPVQPVLFWLLQWVVFTLTVLVPTPGGAGGAEAAFYVLYSAFVPASTLGLATSGWRFLTFYLQLGLAAILFPLLKERRTLRLPA